MLLHLENIRPCKWLGYSILHSWEKSAKRPNRNIDRWRWWPRSNNINWWTSAIAKGLGSWLVFVTLWILYEWMFLKRLKMHPVRPKKRNYSCAKESWHAQGCNDQQRRWQICYETSVTARPAAQLTAQARTSPRAIQHFYNADRTSFGTCVKHQRKKHKINADW